MGWAAFGKEGLFGIGFGSDRLGFGFATSDGLEQWLKLGGVVYHGRKVGFLDGSFVIGLFLQLLKADFPGGDDVGEVPFLPFGQVFLGDGSAFDEGELG